MKMYAAEYWNSFQGNFFSRHLTLLCLQLHLCDFVRLRYVISDLPASYLILILKKQNALFEIFKELTITSVLHQMVKLV